MILNEKQALKKWDAYIKALRRSTSVDMDESPQAKEMRIERLLNDPVEFFKYYFPHYCASEFNSKQIEAIGEIINNKTIYAVLEWARGHAKSSTVAPMVVLYLTFKEQNINMLMVSYNETNAIELLKPIRIELEKNQRILNDFGTQRSLSNWEDKKFVTRNGSSFRAIGSGQSPRGTREEEVRPNIIVCDDLDEDEMLRNPRRLDQTWEWVGGALFNCFDLKGNKRFIVINNRIAKDCILSRAVKICDFHSVVNAIKKATTKAEREIVQTQFKQVSKQINKEHIPEKISVLNEALKLLRDGYLPTWHQRYSMQEICYVMVKIGYRMFQREYMNNPTSEGKVFKQEYFQYKKLPKLSVYKNFLLSYLDPSFKNKKSSDTKSWGLWGLLNGEIHLIKVFCDRASIENMVEWGYSLNQIVLDGGGACQHYMEEVFLQDLLYKDFAAAATRKKYPLPLKGDTRKKPDKDARILSTAGYFERGAVWFNEAEKDSHHQKRFEDQLLNFEAGVNTLKDGPDAMEGAFYKLFEMVHLNADLNVGTRSSHSNKHKL